VIKGWREKGRRGKRGRPFLYSEKAILFMVAIGSLFHLLFVRQKVLLVLRRLDSN